MKVLVTGATGFVGSNLVRELLRDGQEVRALVRKGGNLANLAGLDLELAVGGLWDKDSLIKAAQGCQVVYHVAALYSEREEEVPAIYRTNVEGTKNMLEAARRAGVGRLIYTSTIGTIGRGRGGHPPNEDFPFDLWDSSSHYVRSKYLAERGALATNGAGLEVVVVNPCAPVGPFDIRPSPTGRRILDFLAGIVPPYPGGGINFIHVRDVAKGHILAASKGKAGRRYILGHQNLSLADFLELMEKVSGQPRPGPAGSNLRAVLRAMRRLPNGRASGLPTLTADCSRAIQELGLPQSPLQQAFQEAVNWFREKGYVRSEAKVPF
jgi:dihydroflavonol-4-reductase